MNMTIFDLLQTDAAMLESLQKKGWIANDASAEMGDAFAALFAAMQAENGAALENALPEELEALVAETEGSYNAVLEGLQEHPEWMAALPQNVQTLLQSLPLEDEAAESLEAPEEADDVSKKVETAASEVDATAVVEAQQKTKAEVAVTAAAPVGKATTAVSNPTASAASASETEGVGQNENQSPLPHTAQASSGVASMKKSTDKAAQVMPKEDMAEQSATQNTSVHSSPETDASRNMHSVAETETTAKATTAQQVETQNTVAPARQATVSVVQAATQAEPEPATVKKTNSLPLSNTEVVVEEGAAEGTPVEKPSSSVELLTQLASRAVVQPRANSVVSQHGHAESGEEDATTSDWKTAGVEKTAAQSTDISSSSEARLDVNMTATAASTKASELPAETSQPQSAELDTVSVQTVKHVRYLVSKGGKTVTVRLVPESLGELRMEVHSNGQDMTVRLVSSNPVVRDTLEAQTQGLRDALSREGIDVSRVEVSTSMNQQSPHSDGQSNQQLAQDFKEASSQRTWAMQRSYQQRSQQAPIQMSQRTHTHQGALNLFA